ncbi:16S rRNA (guanine(527)-N(7))-methyltransferase RsmG [Actinosynnema sp. NPDC020468]|uniref:16S rRNA (guanine(527)-N(7))-methyltransferase RsmG n=1 Tax=Actinosynnema sp. NPDC020468 TaxID=3154488 RepID=UPI0033DF7F3C
MTGDVEDRVKQVFGDHADKAVAFATMLSEQGVERGLIGPREVDRLWDRHLLNSAVVAELFDEGSRVVDVGSGGGLPGVPLAIVRPDLDLTFLEPMERRVKWLTECVDALGLANVTVLRGRAEEGPVRKQLDGSDAVTARAVAPLEKLARWCLPLLRPGGRLVALKGESAAEELERDADAVRRAGGSRMSVTTVGGDVLELPTTVVLVERDEPTGRAAARRRRKER